MTRREVLAAIRKAIEAIEAYQRENLHQRTDLMEDRRDNERIKHEAQNLHEVLAKSMALSPSGTPCPTCGGSGRI